MAAPRIHVYTVCWNEERMLPFFLDHYARFAERIVVFDNGSTDRTAEIARAHPRCEWRPYDTGGELDERNLLRVKNEAWKEHRGESDWAIAVDADELVTFGGLDPLAVAAACDARGLSVVQPIGYNIVLDAAGALPEPGGPPLVEAHHLGVHKKKYSKPCMWSTRRVESIAFGPGAHDGVFVPRPRTHRDLRIRLYHYRYLGLGPMLARHRLYAARLSQTNKEKRFGYEYTRPEARIRAEYEAVERRRRDVRPTVACAPVVGFLLRGAYSSLTRIGLRL